MKVYYTVSPYTDPYLNLAMEQDLFSYCSEGEIILFIWQNADTVVVGRNQDVISEIQTDEFLRDGGRIARRLSGGGAVYHDMGNLCYSIICVKEDRDECRYYTWIKEALQRMGIEAEFNGRNDLLIEGKKFSGNAIYDNGNIICQHGTLLVNTDIHRMNYYLTPSKKKWSGTMSRVWHQELSIFLRYIKWLRSVPWPILL